MATKTTSRWLFSISATLIGLLAACGQADLARSPTFMVTDSGGIQVVTNVAPAWSPEEVWRVSPIPTLRIGQREGSVELTFGKVRAAGWLSDGRIFVGDEQKHAISVFSPEGDYLETAGGEGEGPGELQWFVTVAPYRQDSIFVYDYAQRVVSIFDSEFQYSRRFRNPVPENNYWVVEAMADGRFILYTPGQSRLSGGPGLIPDTSLIILAAPDGSSADTVAAFEVALRSVGASGFAESYHMGAVGAIVAARDRIIWSEGRVFEFVEASADGTIRRVVRTLQGPVPVTDQVIREFQAHYLELLSGSPGADPDRLQRSLDEAQYASHLPATFAEMKVDELGHLWVGRYHFPGLATEEWEVFDSAGVWLGTVTTPPDLEVHTIGVDRIIGVGTDEFDVQYVQVHGLDRR